MSNRWGGLTNSIVSMWLTNSTYSDLLSESLKYYCAYTVWDTTIKLGQNDALAKIISIKE